MNVDRLTRLAVLLDNDADNDKGVQFDLGSWAAPSASNPDGERYYWFSDAKLPEVSCGTSACALGLAAISGEFKADGLTAEYVYAGLREPNRKRFTLLPSYNGETGFEAGQCFFDISNEDSRYLFDPDCYASKQTGAEGERFVAQRIRDFISGEIDQDQHPEYRYNDEGDCDEGDCHDY